MASYGGAWPSIWPFRMQWLLLQFCFWNIMQVSPWPPLPQNHTVLARMWRSRNSQTLLVGMQNGTATLEDSLVVSYKTKHTLTIHFSNQVLVLLSCVQLFATPWTEICQAPPSMGFSRKEYWNGLPFPGSAIKLLIIYSKKLKTYVYTKTCIQLFKQPYQ